MRHAPHVLDLNGDGIGCGEGPHDGEEVPHQEDCVARHRELRGSEVGAGWGCSEGGVWRWGVGVKWQVGWGGGVLEVGWLLGRGGGGAGGYPKGCLPRDAGHVVLGPLLSGDEHAVDAGEHRVEARGRDHEASGRG